jgi:hypothetical protein
MPERDLVLFDRSAPEHRLNRTEYMIPASTGDLDDPLGIGARLDAIEQRLRLVE